jgi:hypothetical protein
LEEASAADHRRQVPEEREKELLASNAALEQQIQARQATLAAPPREAPASEKEVLEHEDALMFEALEQSLELERLEVKERQVVAAEDAIAVREARVRLEVKLKVDRAREALASEFQLKLEQLWVEAEGRISALRGQLTAMAAREVAAREALASSQAELSSLQGQVTDAETAVSRAMDEARRHRAMMLECASMLEDLRTRANQALGSICEESAPRPREVDDAGNLHFFMQVVARLEDRAARAHELVEERSWELLGRAFSRVFSNLFSLDPYFDFDAAIAPVPEVTQDAVAEWVNNHVDDLVEEFTLVEDATMTEADEVVDADSEEDGGAGGNAPH